MKQRPNHREYLRVLRRMSPEARLRKAFELSRFSRELFRRGLERRFPDRSDDELDALLLRRLETCHSRSS